MIPKTELEKIMDAVTQGVKSAKESDNDFWNEQKKYNIEQMKFNEEARLHFYDHDQTNKQIHGTLEKILKTQDISNGRVGKLEKWQERIKGMAQIITIVVLPILGFLSYEVIRLISRK